MQRFNFDDEVDSVLEQVGDMLKAKNRAYGDSALNPVRVFSKSDTLEQINVRLDDKLSRIARGSEFANEDTELDIIGYMIIKRIHKIKESKDEARN